MNTNMTTTTTTTHQPTTIYPTYYHQPTSTLYSLDPTNLSMLGEGSDRAAYQLDTNLVLKVDHGYATDPSQCVEEVHMWNWLVSTGATDHVTTIYSDMDLAKKGFVVAEMATSIYDYLWEILDEDDFDEVVGDLSDALDALEGVLDQDVYDPFATFIHNHQIVDVHGDNLGIIDGRLVMLDLGWGSGSTDFNDLKLD